MLFAFTSINVTLPVAYCTSPCIFIS